MAKGGTFENTICRELSLWISQGARDDLFCRTGGSGGRFTARRKSGKDTANQSGDITFNDIDGEALIAEWSIECKTGYGKKKKIKDSKNKVIKKIDGRWDCLDMIDSSQKETILEKMWAQAVRDAEASGKLPILIFRRNMRTACIAMWKTYFLHLSHYFGEPYSVNIEIDTGKKHPFNVVLMSLDDFFRWIPDISSALTKKKLQKNS